MKQYALIDNNTVPNFTIDRFDNIEDALEYVKGISNFNLQVKWVNNDTLVAGIKFKIGDIINMGNEKIEIKQETDNSIDYIYYTIKKGSRK